MLPTWNPFYRPSNLPFCHSAQTFQLSGQHGLARCQSVPVRRWGFLVSGYLMHPRAVQELHCETRGGLPDFFFLLSDFSDLPRPAPTSHLRSEFGPKLVKLQPKHPSAPDHVRDMQTCRRATVQTCRRGVSVQLSESSPIEPNQLIQLICGSQLVLQVLPGAPATVQVTRGNFIV